MTGQRRFSTILAATVLLVVAAALVVVVGMDRGSPADIAYASGLCGDAVADRSNTGLVSDCEILLGLKSALRGSGSLNWWSGRSIEQWDGIAVQGGRVTGLSLPNRGLDGVIPAALGSLSALTTLDLSGNSLTGQIPEELNNLANLTRWRLAGNSLSGCVPSTFAQVSDNDSASLNLPTCGATGPTRTPVPTVTPTPAPPGATPTPAPTETPGNTDDRLTAVEGRLGDVEKRVASLEEAVSGLTGTPPKPTR